MAQQRVLTNGTYMQGSCCDNPPTRCPAECDDPDLDQSTGSGKFDVYDEEGLTLLPGGKVLDVDAYVYKYNANGMNYETYNPGTGTWTSAGQYAGSTVGLGRQLRRRRAAPPMKWVPRCCGPMARFSPPEPTVAPPATPPSTT